MLLTVPVAVHCLYALGFQLGSPRVLAHSLAGCFVYGVFVAKMLVLPRPNLPRWGIPVLGGVLFSALAARLADLLPVVLRHVRHGLLTASPVEELPLEMDD